MTPREQSVFNAGIEAVRQAAMVAAVSIEIRAARATVRDQAAIAALRGLAEGARALMLGAEADEPFHPAFAAIAAEPGETGTIACPACKGRLAWVRDRDNGHVHGECETAGCLVWMQ